MKNKPGAALRDQPQTVHRLKGAGVTASRKERYTSVEILNITLPGKGPLQRDEPPPEALDDLSKIAQAIIEAVQGDGKDPFVTILWDHVRLTEFAESLTDEEADEIARAFYPNWTKPYDRVKMLMHLPINVARHVYEVKTRGGDPGGGRILLHTRGKDYARDEATVTLQTVNEYREYLDPCVRTAIQTNKRGYTADEGNSGN